MTLDQISHEVDGYLTTIRDAHWAIKKLQESCTHPNAVKIPDSNTGNWDKSEDSYWLDCRCPHCRKTWTEEQ